MSCPCNNCKVSNLTSPSIPQRRCLLLAHRTKGSTGTTTQQTNLQTRPQHTRRQPLPHFQHTRPNSANARRCAFLPSYNNNPYAVDYDAAALAAAIRIKPRSLHTQVRQRIRWRSVLARQSALVEDLRFHRMESLFHRVGEFRPHCVDALDKVLVAREALVGGIVVAWFAGLRTPASALGAAHRAAPSRASGALCQLGALCRVPSTRCAGTPTPKPRRPVQAISPRL